jgi:cysteinyl-tRNA synthetase
LLQLLGFFPQGLSVLGGGEAPAAVRGLADARIEARGARDWARADALRREIEALGWVVEDRAGGYRLKPRN